jgi:hypothetical protein
MSELVTYAGYQVKDIAALPLKNMLGLLIADADYVMGAGMDDAESVKLIRWLVNYLYEKYGYLPMTHIEAAIKEGCVGRRGGTSKLVPRNIIIWISEQEKIYQEQHVSKMKKVDEERRHADMKGTKTDSLIAKAVRIKIGWHCDGRISSDEYDRVSSQKIYDLLKTGKKESEITVREVMI